MFEYQFSNEIVLINNFQSDLSLDNSSLIKITFPKALSDH